jgi:DNA ligase (NAD+)
MNPIKNLELEIIKHKDLYYQGKPEISDEEYDKLESSLKELDPDNSVLSIVGTTNLSGEKIQHEVKMLSLNKTYKLADLLSWSGTEEVISTFKIDGSSCSLVYENGILQKAKTRGDGRFGENILNKVLCIEKLPKALSSYKDKIEVRGEIYCTEENFFKLSNEMEKMNLEKPSSKRNIVAGLLGRKENYELCRFLSFQAFEAIEKTRTLKTEIEKFNLLEKLKFQVPNYQSNTTKEDFDKRLNEAEDFMGSGNYLIDGIVFTLNDLSLHEELGETSHHPRYKMAFKFQGETKNTKIESISWQVSRNGYLTPVANIKPVELSGAQVSRVTLHNYGMVKQFQLMPGDTIEVVRSGEVIPKFLGLVEKGDNEFERPLVCPSCSEQVFEKEIRLVCENKYCPDKVKDEILNFIQKIGIDDLSGKRLEELIKSELVTDIPSLYNVKVDDLLKMEKVKDKLANKIVSNIEKSKEVDLITFLSSLGITGGAYNKCEKVVNNGINTIEKILSVTKEQLINIESFADKSAEDFVESIKEKTSIIKSLLIHNFEFKESVSIKESSITGLKFCVTGTLSMKRSDLQKLIKVNGGIVVSSVNKNTNYVITNDTESSSSKFVKAKELNIKIISEDEFKKMIT